jgi:hypothetical protein
MVVDVSALGKIVEEPVELLVSSRLLDLLKSRAEIAPSVNGRREQSEKQER